MKRMMLVAAALCGSMLSANAQIRITGDMGGQIGPYIERLVDIRNSGQVVIIDGPCLSACTLVLGVIPRDRVCVTRRARLGFHSSWHRDGRGRPVRSPGGNQIMMAHYDPGVRAWAERSGALQHHTLKYMPRKQLTAMYRSCN